MADGWRWRRPECWASLRHPCQHGDTFRGIGPLCAASVAVAVAVALALTRAATVAVAVAVKSPLMAPRRWCRNRIKKRPLSERSEFRTLPDFGASGVGSPRSGPPSPGSPFLAYVFWRSKRGRSAAGPRPGLVVRQDSRIASSASRRSVAKLPLTLATVAQRRKALLLRVADG